MVLIVEPGLYIPAESLGVRIEDAVPVAADGYQNLSAAAPRIAADIERLRAPGREPGRDRSRE